MSKVKPLVLLFAMTSASLLSACDLHRMVDDPRPDDLCTDLGEGHCPVPEPDDITT